MGIWILKNDVLLRYSSNLNTMCEILSDKVFPFFIFIFIRLFLEQSYSCNYRPVKVHRKIGNTVGMNATLELLIAYCTGDGQKTHFYWKWWSLEEQSYKTSEIWTGWRVCQYGLWSFQTGGKKLKRFLPKNQHTQRKLLRILRIGLMGASEVFKNQSFKSQLHQVLG